MTSFDGELKAGLIKRAAVMTATMTAPQQQHRQLLHMALFVVTSEAAGGRGGVGDRAAVAAASGPETASTSAE